MNARPPTGAAAVGRHGGTAMHGLLPLWLELIAVAVFVAVALSHLRHMVATDGQRRPWHAGHVLMAAGMAFMYAPGAMDHLPGVSAVWRLALAAAGLLAGAWAIWGASSGVNPVWLLTALDCGAMLFMWSPDPGARAVGWLVLLYLLADGAMWTLDAYRRFEGERSILRWLPVGELGGAGSVGLARISPAGAGLLGDLDIGPSMAVMSFGMAYMLVVMQLS
jgi:hypothetical protein